MMRDPEDILDELLVLRSQDGEKRAWRNLVRRWNPRFLAHAQRVTGRAEVAADVTQEAWLAMIRGIGGLEDPARFRSWAFRILANKIADWARRKKIEPVTVDHDHVLADQEDEQSSADERAHAERLKQLRKAIRQLPDEKRALLTMVYLEDMSLAEAALALGIPEGTVKSRLFHLRQDLREKLESLEHAGH
ncbi:MAG TPA: RNA polymerase sigma factor [Pirellulaceae bacterium]